MRSLSSLGIGLSLVFGCLLLALIAELYYLLWWKKRIINSEIEDEREFFHLFCWKKPSSLSSTALNPQRLGDTLCHETDQNQLGSKDYVLKPYGEDGIETELMRLHNLAGPPRFLFTIKEETKEDLESEDGRSKGDNKSRKGSRGRSLSDLLLAVETPFMTPLSSPAFYTPPLTPIENYSHHGFNPLFESSTDVEMNSIKASPPPKFKFLKDAEEKLQRRLLLEENERRMKSKAEEDRSYISILVSKSQEKDNHYHSSSSQVIPLSSSPSGIRTTSMKSIC